MIWKGLRAERKHCNELFQLCFRAMSEKSKDHNPKLDFGGACGCTCTYVRMQLAWGGASRCGEQKGPLTVLFAFDVDEVDGWWSCLLPKYLFLHFPISQEDRYGAEVESSWLRNSGKQNTTGTQSDKRVTDEWGMDWWGRIIRMKIECPSFHISLRKWYSCH